MKITKKVAKDLIKEALIHGQSQKVITDDIGRNYLRNMVSLSNEYHETNLTVKSFKDGAIIEVKKPVQIKLNRDQKESIIKTIKRYPALSQFLMHQESPIKWDNTMHKLILDETANLGLNSAKANGAYMSMSSNESMV